MADLFYVRNDGPLILATNYWDLPEAAMGKFLVSLNAGAFRLLVPPAFEGSLDDFRSARGCAVSRGPWPAQRLSDAFEVLFDDGTTDPFTLHLSAQSFDRLPTRGNVAHEWALTVWTRPRQGRPFLALELPCRYRVVPRLPWLQAWDLDPL